MVWFLLMPVVFFFAVKEFCFDYDATGFLDRFLGFVLSLMIALIAGLISAGAALICGLPFQSHPVEIGTDTLVAIRTKDGIEGQFFLGSGAIQGNQYYFYYRELADGGVTPGKVYAGSGVRVYEEPRQDATLTTYQWQLDQPWAWVVSIPTSAGGRAYDFRVPTGTILRGFQL